MGISVLVWALNASRVGDAVEGCLSECTTIGERRADTWRVLSLNVLHGFPTFEKLTLRLDLIAQGIRAADADIVCLQEVPWTLSLGSGAAYLAQATGMNYAYLRANGNRYTILFEEGSAILSRYPLRTVSFAELKPQAGFFEHRIVLHAVVATPSHPIDVFVTHISGETHVNPQQIAFLKAFVDQHAQGLAIVAGDFNATPEAASMAPLMREWVDTYRAGNPDDAGLTCCIDGLSNDLDEPLEERIDYLFVVPRAGQAVRVRAAQRVFDRPFRSSDGWQWASDHVGLLATIEWEP